MADETKKFMSADNLLYVWQIIKLKLQEKVDKVDGRGLSTNDYTTAEKEKLAALNNYVDTEIRNLIASINSKIPEEASSTNKLADQAFVNSSIATNTATFRGTYEKVSDLPTKSTISDLKINDYAFVITGDVGSNPEYARYKYDGSKWIFEYTLNNSSFTQYQWDAINSGINQTGVEQITKNKNEINNHIADKQNPHLVDKVQIGLGNVDNTSDKDKPISTATQLALDLKTNDSSLSAVAKSGSYNDLSNKPTMPTVDTALSTTSTNAVQNKVVTAELNKKLNASSYVVDTVLDSSSTNPVRNSVITTALLGKAPSYQPLKSASFTFADNRLYLTLKNQLDEAIAEPNVSLAGIAPTELTNAEIDTIFAS